MRIAALYDIHGNLPALEAVLCEVREEPVDLLVIGGDVVPGPMPAETMDLLLALDVPVRFIKGNGDADVLAARAGRALDHLPEPVRDLIGWTGGQLTPEHVAAMDEWPDTLRLGTDTLGDVLFCHATPHSRTDIFTRLTPAERLRPVFDGVAEPVVVCGHTHMPFDRTIGAVRVVNAGSVGMPFGEPGAHWVWLGPDIQPRRTDYNLTAAAERIRGTDYPQAREFADRNVLTPPSEAEMLAAFAP